MVVFNSRSDEHTEEQNRAQDFEEVIPESSDLVEAPPTTSSEVIDVQATQHGGRHDFNALVQALPTELQLEILQQNFLATWTANITVPKGTGQKFALNEPDDPDLPTHRAMFVRLSLRVTDMPPDSNVGVDDLHNMGWVIIPLYPGRFEASASTFERGLRAINHSPLNPYIMGRRYKLPTIGQAEENWDAFRPSRILGSIAYSKAHQKYLKGDFFRGITWVFNNVSRIHDAFENPECRLPPGVLRNLRSICLEIGDPWQVDRARREIQWNVFTVNFEYLLHVLLRPDSPLPSLTLLELNGQNFEPKVFNIFTGRVTDEAVRIKYLVTRCYQLVKARPGIKILLSGSSSDTPTKVSPNLTPRRSDGHRALRYGLKYSDQDVLAFCETVHEMWRPSLEVDLSPNNLSLTYPAGPAHTHFKIGFVLEWATIWKLGLRSESNPEGYQGVENRASTFDNVDEQDDDPDQTDSDLDSGSSAESESDSDSESDSESDSTSDTDSDDSEAPEWFPLDWYKQNHFYGWPRL